jgi:hypothetical protein
MIFAKAIASKVFKIYSPALFVRRVGRKVMLSACRSMANSNDILSDLNGEIVYVLRIPRIVPIYRAALRNSRQFTAEKKAKRQQQRPDCHIDTRNTRTAQLYAGSGGLQPPYAVGWLPAARCRDFDERVSRPLVDPGQYDRWGEE